MLGWTYKLLKTWHRDRFRRKLTQNRVLSHLVNITKNYTFRPGGISQPDALYGGKTC